MRLTLNFTPESTANLEDGQTYSVSASYGRFRRGA
jgi:hypothetical protein